MFAKRLYQAAPYCPKHPLFLPHAFLLWQTRLVAHQRPRLMPRGLQRPHYSTAHTAVQQDGPQNKKASPPSKLYVEVVTQDRQSAQAQGCACGGHGIGKHTPTHKVMSQYCHSRLETETETKSWNKAKKTIITVIVNFKN